MNADIRGDIHDTERHFRFGMIDEKPWGGSTGSRLFRAGGQVSAEDPFIRPSRNLVPDKYGGGRKGATGRDRRENDVEYGGYNTIRLCTARAIGGNFYVILPERNAVFLLLLGT